MFLENFRYHGIILSNDPCSGHWDSGVATFCNVFIDPDNPREIFLYYTGATDINLSHSAIGLAVSSNGLNFRKIDENPIVEGARRSFCSKTASTPAVTKVGNKYYMILSGQSSSWLPRPPMSMGIAWADDPKGPWKIIGEVIKPKEKWEGRGIDNGPGIVSLTQDTILVFYSNNSLVYSDLFLKFFRNPTLHITPNHLYRYIKRRIGILKVRIRGPNSIEAYRYHGNPLIHLNGPSGSWNESLFCPGYAKLNNKHYLFPAASTYSCGYPFPQSIACVISRSPFFEKNSVRQIIRLINGSNMMRFFDGDVALDTPNFEVYNNKIFLYYSIMNQSDHTWKIALSTAELP